MLTARGVIGRLATLCPLEPPSALVAHFGRSLRQGCLFVSPSSYARASMVLLLSPLPAEAACAFIPLGPALFVLAAAVCVQASPFLIPSQMASARGRGVEAELPFFAMLLFVLSKGPAPGLSEGLSKAASLGAGSFPALGRESALLSRTTSYSPAPEHLAVEETFGDHPSRRFREFVQGYMTTVASGRDVTEFIRTEGERLLSLMDEAWRSFATMVSSMAEVAFIFLSLFPIGMQMIAGTFLGGTSLLLAASSVALVLLSAVILAWMDRAQPLLDDETYPAWRTGAALAGVAAVLACFYLGAIGPGVAGAVCLVVTAAHVSVSHGFFARLSSGEREVAAILHGFAESARSGGSIPGSLSRLLEEPGAFPALSPQLATFARQLSVGMTPEEAQRRVRHPSWLVRVSVALLSAAMEAGVGYGQLERLSQSFKRLMDARHSIRSSVLPFAALGLAVPAISAASFWFIGNMQALGTVLPGFSFSAGAAGVGFSILATSVLTGTMVSKALSLSFRTLVGVPPILVSAILSFLLFGIL